MYVYYVTNELNSFSHILTGVVQINIVTNRL